MKTKPKRSWWKRIKFWSQDEVEMGTRPVSTAETDPRSIGEKTKGGKTFFGIKFTWPLIMVFCVGCANYSTTKFKFIDESGSEVEVEIPKEIVAKNLKVTLNAKDGEATITADDYNSQNQGTIDAGTLRDMQVIKATSDAVGTALGQAAAAGAKGVAP